MLLDKNRVSFLKPSSLLFELLVLSEIEKSGFKLEKSGAFEGIEKTMVHAYTEDLAEKGLVKEVEEKGHGRYLLTKEGEARKRYLLVDYLNELIYLQNQAKEIFRKRFAEIYLKGVRRIAFYPAGETAEVASKALYDSGLELILVVDDDSDKWGMEFGDLKIDPPRAIHEIKPDAVVITTCVFQPQVMENIKQLGVDDIQVFTL